MKFSLNTFAAVCGAIGLAILAQPNCAAQCGPPKGLKLGTSFQLEPNNGAIRLLPAGFGQGSDTNGHMPAIVGFWHVKFTANTMDGKAIPDTVIDNALVTWHSDGTETMNSGRPAQDGNFCMGVWEQTASSTFKLNHFALGNQYTPGTPNGVVGEPAGPTRFTETVTVAADGNHYTGTFTLTAYDTSGNVTTTFTGSLWAKRIALYTDVPEIL